MISFLRDNNKSLYNEIIDYHNRAKSYMTEVVRFCESYVRNFISYRIPVTGVVISKDGQCFELSKLTTDAVNETIFVSGTFVSRRYRCSYKLEDFDANELIFLVNVLDKHFNDRCHDEDFEVSVSTGDYLDYLSRVFDLEETDVLDVESACVVYNGVPITHIVRMQNGAINLYSGDPANDDLSMKIQIDKGSDEFFSICERLVSNFNFF